MRPSFFYISSVQMEDICHGTVRGIIPNITPHVCHYTYCSNMARAGMDPKTLQYLMGHSDIGVTMNIYAHLGLEDAQNEMNCLEELNRAKEEVAKAAGEKKPLTQRSFRAV